MVEWNPNMERIVTVVGGSGFLGRHVVRELADRGFRIRVAVRRPELAGHVQPLFQFVGQIQVVQANIRDRASIERAAANSHAVINLVGVLFERGRQTFEAVQAEGAGRVAEVARAAGAQRLVHLSAIGADAGSPSAYARSKARGEDLVRAAMPGATVLRPSVVFGPEDNFFNRFAAMAQFAPVLPVVGGATRFQPVFVGDVARAVGLAVDGPARPGVYELGGPEVKTFRELMQLMLEVVGRRRIIVEMPPRVADTLARIAERLPGTPPLTRDQIALLARDNVVSEEARAEGRTFEAFGIVPEPMALVLPTYLTRFRRFGQFGKRPAADARAALTRRR